MKRKKTKNILHFTQFALPLYFGMQTTNLKVSFILTYYNQPVKMLRECLESILVLSLRPYEREIIIIDDGSAESPINELLKYGDDIIYVRQKNKGLSEARNLGMRMASGLYLQFIDADDYLNQAAYEHSLDLVRYNQPDMVVFDFSHHPTHGATFEDQGPLNGASLMKQQNIHGTACGYIFNRAILGTLRFTPNIYHEDEEFTPRLLLQAQAVYRTNAKAYVYRKHKGTITSKKDNRSKIKRLADKLYVITSLRNMITTLPYNEQQAINRRVAQLTMDYIYNVIVQTRSRHYLERTLSLLQREGLFPLPDKNYTTKYKWFRRLTNSNFGRKLLIRVLPLLKRER